MADAQPAGWSLQEFKATDGYAWRYRKYPGAEPAKGQLVFLHGIQSHAGWYQHSCSWLSARGWEVSFIDRRGSGANYEDRGDAPSFRRLVDDVAEYLQALPRSVTTPNGVVKHPVFLAAISWGGKLAVALERRHPGLIDGLILMCPGIAPRIKPSVVQRLKILMSRFFRPRKFYDIPLNDPELFTATPHWQDFLRQDSHRLHRATARFLIESARLDGYLRFAPKYVHVPSLLLLAEQDRIIHNEKTRAFVERFPNTDKTIIEYAGAHHTLEFEPDPSRFLEDMNRWLDAHLPQPPAA